MGNHALEPSTLGAARHVLAGVWEHTLHNQIPINTEQRLQPIDCPPSGLRVGPGP